MGVYVDMESVCAIYSSILDDHRLFHGLKSMSMKGQNAQNVSNLQKWYRLEALDLTAS